MTDPQESGAAAEELAQAKRLVTDVEIARRVSVALNALGYEGAGAQRLIAELFWNGIILKLKEEK